MSNQGPEAGTKAASTAGATTGGSRRRSRQDRAARTPDKSAASTAGKGPGKGAGKGSGKGPGKPSVKGSATPAGTGKGAGPRAERRKRRELQRSARQVAKAEPVPESTGADTEGGGQLRALLRCSHPKQALLLAAVVGVLAAWSDRPPREVASAAGAVLVVQLLLGLGNDVSDISIDRAAGVEGKPLAAGQVPRGNVTYAIMVLLLIAVPLSMQNGAVAGSALLASIVVGAVHNRWLRRGWLSWLGWTITPVLLVAFLAYGGWGGGRHGAPPTWEFSAAAAAVGFCAHFLTSLPDLVGDHKAGLKHLPLRVALRTGAPALLWITLLLSVLAAAALVWAGLTVGLRQ